MRVGEDPEEADMVGSGTLLVRNFKRSCADTAPREVLGAGAECDVGEFILTDPWTEKWRETAKSRATAIWRTVCSYLSRNYSRR